MPKYVIERELPGAGDLSDEELRTIAQKSNAVLDELGGRLQWNHSYLTADKLYCVYIAPDDDSIREHARRGGFPADSVARVLRMIDPTTGEDSR
jgi:hypothetical protein